MKGLVLSGGFGTRLRPLTYSQQKQLIPVANKPILFYALEDLIEAGIHEIGIIVGPNKEQVIETVKGASWDAKIHFIEQEQPLGIAHTIKISKGFLKNDSFVMYLGDNILKEGIVNHVKDFETSDYEASILLTPVNNPEEFGIAMLNKHKDIVKIIEKPAHPRSNLAVIGVYLFRSKIHEAVKKIKFSKRHQLEITDSIQWLIDHGYKVKSALVQNWWKDTGKPEDILHANRLVIDTIESSNKGKVSHSEIRGRVQIQKDTIIENHSTVKGPVIIGEHCRIQHSYIGPYTSVGNHCEIVNSEIEDSVIMEGTTIIDGGRIVDSLIGRGVHILKKTGLPNGRTFVIGDQSEVSL
jgi:glucose-1-phosphate thymidylyltransferase